MGLVLKGLRFLDIVVVYGALQAFENLKRFCIKKKVNIQIVDCIDVSVMKIRIYIFLKIFYFNPLSANPTKSSSTQTVRRKIADELFNCILPFCVVDA